MTPHMSQAFSDGSVAIKIYPGGRWKVGKMNGHGYDCDAQQFAERQNEMAVRDFHQKSVREYMGPGEAA